LDTATRFAGYVLSSRSIAREGRDMPELQGAGRRRTAPAAQFNENMGSIHGAILSRCRAPHFVGPLRYRYKLQAAAVRMDGASEASAAVSTGRERSAHRAAAAACRADASHLLRISGISGWSCRACCCPAPFVSFFQQFQGISRILRNQNTFSVCKHVASSTVTL
jgi:hypothetical protein